jgi:hypothetical protein
VRFYDTSVLAQPREGYHVQWRVEPQDDDLSLLELDIQRSESPTSGFVSLQTLDPLTDFSFTDLGAPWRPKNWDIYYRLVAKVRATGGIHYEGLSFGTQGRLPLDALEIIRQHNILLRGLNNQTPLTGIECTIYKKRNFGAQCRSCRDAVTGQIVISQCPECGGTGRANSGYYDPIDVFINLSPHPKFLKLTTLGKLEDNETAAFMTNFPLMYPGDIIVEPSEKHWRVVSIDVTERHRIVVHQGLRLAQVDHNDVVYETLRHSSHR